MWRRCGWGIFCTSHHNKALEICFMWFKWTCLTAWPGRRYSYWPRTWAELSREMSCNPLFFTMNNRDQYLWSPPALLKLSTQDNICSLQWRHNLTKPNYTNLKTLHTDSCHNIAQNTYDLHLTLSSQNISFHCLFPSLCPVLFCLHVLPSIVFFPLSLGLTIFIPLHWPWVRHPASIHLSIHPSIFPSFQQHQPAAPTHTHRVDLNSVSEVFAPFPKQCPDLNTCTRQKRAAEGGWVTLEAICLVLTFDSVYLYVYVWGGEGCVAGNSGPADFVHKQRTEIRGFNGF